MEAIMSEAKAFVKASHEKDVQDGIDPDDEWANLDEYPLRMSDDKQSDNDPFDGGEVEVKGKCSVSCSDTINTAYRTLCLSMLLSPHSVFMFAFFVLGLGLELHLFVFTPPSLPLIVSNFTLLFLLVLLLSQTPTQFLLCAWTPT